MLGDLAAYSFLLSNTESEDVLFLQLLASKDSCVYQSKRARLPLRLHLCISMFLHRGRFSSSNSFPEEQCLVYWSLISTTPIWESGGLPPEHYSSTELSTTVENTPSEDKRDGNSSVRREIPPFAPCPRI